ncbi:5310_t:CDS:1, partial [Paraglomus occultum]
IIETARLHLLRETLTHGPTRPMGKVIEGDDAYRAASSDCSQLFRWLKK